MSEILALTGYAQSGKDTVAEILVANHGFTRISFADPIREAVYALNPIVTPGSDVRVRNLVDLLGWDNVKVQYPEIRRLLQVFGTEVAREQWSDTFWIDLAFSKMEPHKAYVITDCRFPNEAEAIRAHDGKIWRVNRPGVGPVNSHASDNFIGQIPVDAEIDNVGSIADLEVVLDELAFALV